MSNRYDEAAPVRYVSQYVPIPFQELVTLGKYYADERKQFEKDVSDTIKKFGEFSSTSDIDVANYRKESIGKFASLLDEAAMNPNVLKDAAWRSKVLSRINDIDYNQLSRYKKSAENFDIRQKAVAELKAKGLYQEWYDDPEYRDLSKWDTKNQGIMNSLAPDKYTTLEELGSTFTKDLKPTFYKGKSPNTGQSMPYYNWMAISASDIRRQFEEHNLDLLSTSAGMKHYNRVRQMLKQQDPNISEQQVMDSFIEALVREQSDKLIETPVLDSAALQLSVANIAAETKRQTSGSGKTKGNDLPYIFPTKVSNDQQRQIAERARKIEQKNPNLSQQINSDNNKWTQDLVNFYNDISKDTDMTRIMQQFSKDLQNAGLAESLDSIQDDPAALTAYINGIMQYIPERDIKYNDIRVRYNELMNKLASNAYDHNNLTSSALITDTLASKVASGNKMYEKNPWLSVFEQTSNAQLNAIDSAALSVMETNLNTPEQQIIIKALFGDKGIVSYDDLDRNANSSYNWILKNYPEQASLIQQAKDQTNYTKEGSPVTTITGGAFNRNINASADEAYSIRDKVASGLYGNAEVVSVDGLSPVLTPEGESDQYSFRLTVRVPLEKISKDIADKYNTWYDNSVIDNNTIREDTGLYTDADVTSGREYVYVPIFINKHLNSNTKGYMDALYRKSVNATSALKKANETQLSVANPDALSF